MQEIQSLVFQFFVFQVHSFLHVVGEPAKNIPLLFLNEIEFFQPL